MTIEVRVPQLPESVADATLVSWHKKPGDAVVRDENLVDLETDKVVLEVPAPVAGVLKEIKLTDGTTVTSGQLLAVIDETAAAASRRQRARDYGDIQRCNRRRQRMRRQRTRLQGDREAGDCRRQAQSRGEARGGREQG